MAITEAQIEAAQNKLNKVQEAASEVNTILVKVQENILSDDQGNPVVSLTSTQKNQLLAEYNKAKAALLNAVNNLP